MKLPPPPPPVAWRAPPPVAWRDHGKMCFVLRHPVNPGIVIYRQTFEEIAATWALWHEEYRQNRELEEIADAHRSAHADDAVGYITFRGSLFTPR